MRSRYKAALQRAGLKQLRLHDLRHSFGTLAVQAYPITDVKVWMGHADISTTQIYIHHVPQHDAADKLSALVAAASPRPQEPWATGVAGRVADGHTLVTGSTWQHVTTPYVPSVNLPGHTPKP